MELRDILKSTEQIYVEELCETLLSQCVFCFACFLSLKMRPSDADGGHVASPCNVRYRYVKKS